MAVKRYSGTAWITEAGGVPPLPSGMLAPYAGSSAPTGWLLSDGSAVSRTTYPSLFTAIGTTYGSGDGSTTFNLPDLRGRVAAGLDNMGGTDAGRLDIANTSGTVTGSQTVTIASANLPTHTHAIDHDHAAFTSGNDSPDHSHQMQGLFVGVAGGGGSALGYPGGFYNTNTSGANSRHQHNIDVPAFTGTSGNGSFANTAVNNMQPTMVMNYIIKT